MAELAAIMGAIDLINSKVGQSTAVGGSLIGAIGSAKNVKKARAEELKSYNQAKDFLNSEYYRDPLSTVGNRAILKSMDERMKDNLDAINNRAVAGGATMENQLAARQANNEAMGNVYTNLLQGEDARRAALNQQKLSLDMQHSANLQNSYLQNAQNWQAWGAQLGKAGSQHSSASASDGLSKLLSLA